MWVQCKPPWAVMSFPCASLPLSSGCVHPIIVFTAVMLTVFARAAACLQPAPLLRPLQDWEFRLSLQSSWKRLDAPIKEQQKKRRGTTLTLFQVTFSKNVGAIWAFSCAAMTQVPQVCFQEQHHLTGFCVLQSRFCTFCLFIVHLSGFTRSHTYPSNITLSSPIP